ncbi:hypothetical protein Q4519_14860 [Motilimonas sp. 1_MG-2023]|uniref:hypothetical protein n=1 Tax=Motilimonas sp. 1_MG-2023 TaxID=3062672 RepID=UPI0026E41DBA|nr:hypothetical protein [Motilimonas sp. 1_MG-2023]MDO6526965.1 hypothetical protein [Motilimonas sp. 1_MG-2023]
MKLIIIFVILYSCFTYANSPEEVIDPLTTALLARRDELIAAQIKEDIEQGKKAQPATLISTCHKRDEWCKGFMSAAVQSLVSAHKKVCIPRDKEGQPLEEGLWTIVNSWLYRQPAYLKLTLLSAIQQ